MASSAARERKERSGAHRFARVRTWEGGGSVRSVAKVFCSCSVMGPLPLIKYNLLGQWDGDEHRGYEELRQMSST